MSEATETTSGGTPAEAGVLGVTPAAAPAAAAPAPAAPVVAAAPTVDATAEQKAFDAKVSEAIKARDEKSAAETKTKGEAEKAASEKAWAEAKFKAPEGVQRSEAALKEFSAVARELGLKPEQAQKFLDLNDKLEAVAGKARMDELKTERDGWFKELRADKEFGGPKYDATVREANKAFEKFASPALTQFLKATGLDAHPELLKSFAKVGAALRDDSLAGTESNGASKTAQQALADLYRKNSPGMFPKQ